MYKRLLVLAVLLSAALVAPSWGQDVPQCGTFSDGVVTIKCQFSPGATGFSKGTFDFGSDGVISFQFEKILTAFELDVTATEAGPFTADPPDFPAETVCIRYGANGSNCVRYNVTGASGGPVPVRDVNFKGLITVTLNYSKSDQTIHIPAFGHAPGDTTTADFTENILTTYVDPDAPCPGCSTDPAMGGKIPGISSFAALDIPFDPSITPATVCSLTAVPQNSNGGNNPLIEISFKLVANGGSCTNGPFLRDKTATLSVATFDTNGNLVFADLVNGGDANKFHYDNTNHLNVQDINTNGLASGNYNVTVISTKFSPINIEFSIP